ncbi:MAG: hypothetical protein K9I85_03300 [Saprospiraceae bacterium]|nr:hypothetical protein [Saprospiraceae bacterium]
MAAGVTFFIFYATSIKDSFFTSVTFLPSESPFQEYPSNFTSSSRLQTLMTSKQLFAFFTLCGSISIFWLPGCQSTYGPDTDAIIRINQQMCTQFRQEQIQELTDLFADSVKLSLPGSPILKNKQVLQTYWTRYLNPIDLSIRHVKFFGQGDITDSSTDLPMPLMTILSGINYKDKAELRSVIQWTEWQLEYEAEDGVIRSESHPTLLQWTDDDESGWRITWMGQI